MGIIGPEAIPWICMFYGEATVLVKNGLMRVPWFRRPWEHAVGMGVGFWFGGVWVDFEDYLFEKSARRYSAMGMIPKDKPDIFTNP